MRYNLDAGGSSERLVSRPSREYALTSREYVVNTLFVCMSLYTYVVHVPRFCCPLPAYTLYLSTSPYHLYIRRLLASGTPLSPSFRLKVL